MSDATETLTPAMTKALRTEARTAGDDLMVESCDMALRGDADSKAAVCRAINDARAQDDSTPFVRVVAGGAQ